jgi:hypothetical protein
MPTAESNNASAEKIQGHWKTKRAVRLGDDLIHGPNAVDRLLFV